MTKQTTKASKHAAAAGAAKLKKAHAGKAKITKPKVVKVKKPRRAVQKAGNTADYHYFHNKTNHGDCKADYDRILEKCADTPANDQAAATSRQNSQLGANASSVKSHETDVKKALVDIDDQAKKDTGFKSTKKNGWMKNCTGLWQKPGGERGPDNAKVSNTQKFKDQLTTTFANSPNLLTPGAMEDIMAATMASAAHADPCIKARKCLLIPYMDADKTAAGNGCCPGQTGHHLLPSAMFDQYAPELSGDKKTYKAKMKNDGRRPCWKDYDHNAALTICLEGTTNRSANGSHGHAHEETGKIVAPFRKSADMPYTSARDEVADMFSTMFGCDSKCLSEQLDDSLKNKHSCGDLDKAKVSPHSGEANGGPNAPTGPVPAPAPTAAPLTPTNVI
ncbi:hypothetical protein [Massilia antarctica]|uniref:hypothetical protein n=1 Tax=Massilia antarctica TaxID=2765360 RepID=UPI0006BB6854|nr:hypothetical protein [Massilia sp. H27-R4]MCY0913708.1 hypothetical protein [Massilia sp. H27-R4]CUI04617.1 hypothetical protein BN2497_4011 [Janthinobacterium sp. CG23_2]CUU28403.1 hypothetical protein BN3177_4011 [Janthinobacterium sp. CG23_2]